MKGWIAPDGSHWFYTPAWDEWTGWMPHEDGHWTLTGEEFRRIYQLSRRQEMLDEAERERKTP